jgi:branched-chain amino acid transport system ATP-binding protein
MRRDEVSEVLGRVGLYQARAEPAYKLPLGQARLLELARVVAAKPRLVLLDEPTSGMETSDAERLSSVVRDLVRDTGCGIALIEHDVDFDSVAIVLIIPFVGR